MLNIIATWRNRMFKFNGSKIMTGSITAIFTLLMVIMSNVTIVADESATIDEAPIKNKQSFWTKFTVKDIYIGMSIEDAEKIINKRDKVLNNFQSSMENKSFSLFNHIDICRPLFEDSKYNPIKIEMNLFCKEYIEQNKIGIYSLRLQDKILEGQSGPYEQYDIQFDDKHRVNVFSIKLAGLNVSSVETLLKSATSRFGKPDEIKNWKGEYILIYYVIENRIKGRISVSMKVDSTTDNNGIGTMTFHANVPFNPMEWNKNALQKHILPLTIERERLFNLLEAETIDLL